MNPYFIIFIELESAHYNFLRNLPAVSSPETKASNQDEDTIDVYLYRVKKKDERF